MNILIIGSGGREHTMAWEIADSFKTSKLFAAPGNAGTSQIATNVPIAPTDFDALASFVKEKEIKMVVVGPEAPLVEGIHDFFDDNPSMNHVSVIGPKKEAAQLEGSKEFAKKFMARHQIPTARYRSFTKEDLHKGYTFLEDMQPPYVLKADGLAAGKGVLIIEDLELAKQELKSMLVDAKFGAASTKVVIEEFLSGMELSCFVLTDGANYLTLPTAKDYKRIGEKDTGLNTGGMGAVSPAPFADDVFMDKVEKKIIQPTIQGLKEDNIEYKGFIFIGLIKVGQEPYVIEYNVRMGDPETEVVIPRIKNDLVDLLQAVGRGTLHAHQLQVDPRAAATVMAVSGGYPGEYEKGKPIRGLEDVKEAIVFHAGTKLKNDDVVTNGGRVLAVTSLHKDFKEALANSYRELSKISFEKMYYRKDIGFDL